MNATPTDAEHRQIIRGLQAVLAQCTDQIAQMQGMFDDEDGTIRNALDEAEEMQQKASRYLRSQP